MYGGRENAERVAALCLRAHRLLAIGRAAEERAKDCRCRYPDGQPRYEIGGRPAHVCGR